MSLRILFWLLFLGWCAPAPLEAQAQLTDPYEHPHPETGEPGMWIPVWLQQRHVLDAREVFACGERERSLRAELLERHHEASELALSRTETHEANLALHTMLTSAEQARRKREKQAGRRLYWATGSTAVAVITTVVAVILGSR